MPLRFLSLHTVLNCRVFHIFIPLLIVVILLKQLNCHKESWWWNEYSKEQSEKKTDVHEMREVVREQNALRPWCRMTDAICFDREMLYTLRLLSQLPPKNNSLASGETANSRDEAAMSAPHAPPGGASRRRLLITTTLALKYTAANINCSKSPPTRAKPSRVVSEQTTLTASCYLPNCTVSLLLCLYQSTILIHCQVTERTMFIQVSFVGTTCQKPSIAKYHTIHSSDH